MQVSRALALLVIVGFVVALNAEALRAQRQVLVSMRTVPNTPRLLVEFNLTNPSADPAETALEVLIWGTPMEGAMMGPNFEVSSVVDGTPIEYVGKVARRMWPPHATSYLKLRSREYSIALVDLTDEFAFPGAGDYLVRFVAPAFDSSVEFVVTNDVVGSLPIINRRMLPDEGSNNGLGNTNCNAKETQQIDAAVAGAIHESEVAYGCLSKRTCNSLSTRWFGTYIASNYDYDTSVFNKVHARLRDYNFNAYCNPAGCGADVYAYVYPGDKAFTVYLCGAFWSQANERVNTVVHEMSHFTVLGGTDDYAYGKTACLSLAKTNPNRAAHNADNVCYFSEEAAASL